MPKFLLVLFVIFSFSISANVDPFNTYQWNKKNELRGNGKTDTNPWYEWWYYKVVLPETNESFFFVYGVVNPWDVNKTLKGTRSYVGFGDFTSKKQVEAHYPIDHFQSRYNEPYVLVDKHLATDKHIEGDLTDESGDTYKWDIDIKKEWSFNATSWATGRMITNIEWYPAQASAKCTGSVTSNGKLIEFVDAPCYQDRNWGNSFPKWWTWIVSNHFVDSPDTSIAIGGGKPKFFRRFELMEGVAIGLKHKGVEYAWRPNEFHKVKLDVSFGKWEVVGTNRNYKITVSANAPKEDFMDLQFMTPKGKIFHDYETLTGSMTVKLYKRKRGPFRKVWKLIETLKSEHTGIEFGSDDEFSFDKSYKMHL